MADATIRLATPDDAELILELVRELAAFERAPDAVKASADDLRRGMAGQHPSFECLIAEVDGDPAGMAVFFPTYSTWEGRPGLQLHDLYVRERARGAGAGRRLLAELARVALARGCARVDLHVLGWNPARAFYERGGLRHLDGWLPYRAEAEALARLAAGNVG
jgi:GNAT superfamily N-acetyltransferase